MSEGAITGNYVLIYRCHDRAQKGHDRHERDGQFEVSYALSERKRKLTVYLIVDQGKTGSPVFSRFYVTPSPLSD